MSLWPDPPPTEELLAHAARGDEDAVNLLLGRHRAAVQRLVQLRLDHRVRRRADVSDVVQDVLADAARRLPEYLANPVLPFHLWLRHITRDRIIDAHRRHRASAKRSVDREQPVLAPRDDQSSLNLAAQLSDQQLTPAAAVAQRELAQRVEQAITQLDEPDAEIIVMRHYEQLTNQESALALGLTEPAASMRYLRAVRRLRVLLGAGTQSGG